MIPKFGDYNDVPSSWIIEHSSGPHSILRDSHQLEREFQQLGIKQGPPTREHVMDEFRRNGSKDTPYLPLQDDAKWDYIGYGADGASLLQESPTYRNTSTPRPPAEYYKRKLNNSNESCRLCKSNGELPSVYLTHKLKDAYGLVTCPVLKLYTCERCGASGSHAHTLKYCPYATYEERQQCTAILRSVRSNSNRRRRYNSDPRDLTEGPRHLHRHRSQ